MLQITLKGKTTKDLQEQFAQWMNAENSLIAPTVKKVKPVSVASTEEGEGTSTGLTLEKDIMPAMIAYAKRHGKEEAHKILKKFGAKSTKDVLVGDYDALMEAIK